MVESFILHTHYIKLAVSFLKNLLHYEEILSQNNVEKVLTIHMWFEWQ